MAPPCTGLSVPQSRTPSTDSALRPQAHGIRASSIQGRHPCTTRGAANTMGAACPSRNAACSILEVEDRTHSAVLLGNPKKERAVAPQTAVDQWRQGVYGGFGAQGSYLFSHNRRVHAQCCFGAPPVGGRSEKRDCRQVTQTGQIPECAQRPHTRQVRRHVRHQKGT